jgi:hypothetical protein
MPALSVPKFIRKKKVAATTTTTTTIIPRTTSTTMTTSGNELLVPNYYLQKVDGDDESVDEHIEILMRELVEVKRTKAEKL